MGVPCGGVRVVVAAREAIRPVPVGLAIARTLRSRHRDQFRPEAIQNLLVNRATMWAFLRNESLDRLVAWPEIERDSFLNRRGRVLLPTQTPTFFLLWLVAPMPFIIPAT